MAFNPDAYLASKQVEFDPDAYLAGKAEAQPADEELGVLDNILSYAEPAASVLSGAASLIPSGVAGTVQSLNPFADDGAGATAVKSVQQALTYQPRTEGGKENLQLFGKLVKPVGDVMEAVAETTATGGENVANALGLPPAIGYAAGKAIPDAAGMALGGTLAKSVTGSVVRPPKIFSEQSKVKQKIAADIESGGTDKTLAKYMIDGAGKVKTDPIAKEVIKQGVDEGVVAAVKGSSSLDKAKMLKMVETVKKGKKNSLYAAKNRPSDVVGDSLIERVNYVKNVNKEAGKRLDKVAKSLRGKQVNSSPAINNFLESLDEMGVSVGKDLKPRFKGSDVEGLAAPEGAIKNITNRLSKSGLRKNPDAYNLHRMKKYIDEIVTYGKAGEGLAGKTERVLKKLRADLDGTLDSNFPEYDKINTTYSDTITSLNDLQSVAGKKMDLSGKNANKATGTLLRRMMSNATSRVNLVDAIESLEGTAKKYGGSFGDDLATQVLFADELGSMFGAAAKTSLQGDVEKTLKAGQAIRGRTIPDIALDVAGSVANKARNVNEEAAIESLIKLLKP